MLVNSLTKRPIIQAFKGRLNYSSRQVKSVKSGTSGDELRKEQIKSNSKAATKAKWLKTDEEYRQEQSKVQEDAEKEQRRAIFEEYETKRMSKVKRYAKCLPYFNVDKDFVAKDLLHYPLLSVDDEINEDSSEFEKQSLYNDRERTVLKKHILWTKKPETTSLVTDVRAPSVSNIIEIAQPLPTALLEWQFQKIQSLGKDGFYQYKTQNLKVGRVFHKFLEDQLRAKKLNRPAPDSLAEFEGIIDTKHLLKLNETLKRVGQVILIEADCAHENLFYAGRIDCLAYFDGEPYLIDWKINESRKQTIRDLYDTPIQIAAYLGAYLNDPKHAKIRREHKIKGGLFVNICKSTGEIDYHFINYQLAEYFWYKWLAYLRKFWTIVLRYQ